MSKCVHLFTNSEVKHVREGFHGEFLSAACVQKSRFIFSNKVSIRVRWLVGLWQLPGEGELLWWIKISQLLILSNHLGGLSSSVTGEMGTFCWAATDCLRGDHLKVLATMMIIIICRCAMIAAWLVSLPAVDREVAEVFKDEVGFTRSFSKEIHRRIRHWRFDEC